MNVEKLAAAQDTAIDALVDLALTGGRTINEGDEGWQAAAAIRFESAVTILNIGVDEPDQGFFAELPDFPPEEPEEISEDEQAALATVTPEPPAEGLHGGPGINPGLGGHS